MITILILILFLLFPAIQLKACTTFALNRNNSILLAKNLDWSTGEGFIVTNQANVSKKAILFGEQPQLRWKSKYNSITFNLLGKDFPLGGINEHGLVIEEMNYSPSEYPSRNRYNLNEFQWIQYHLDQCRNIDEVLSSCDTINIRPFLAKLHYMLCDASGNVAIIEYLKENMKIYRGKDLIVPVLTNNSYPNSIKYLRFHQGFGGNRKVSNSPQSPERFVRTATLNKKLFNNDNRQTISQAFSILDSVKQHNTQWQIIYEITDRKIYFQTKLDSARKIIDFDSVDFLGPIQIMFINCENCSPKHSQFENYTKEKNNLLIKTVLGKLIEAQEISSSRANELMLKLLR